MDPVANILGNLTPEGKKLYKKLIKKGHPHYYAFDAALANIDLTK